MYVVGSVGVVISPDRSSWVLYDYVYFGIHTCKINKDFIANCIELTIMLRAVLKLTLRFDVFQADTHSE